MTKNTNKDASKNAHRKVMNKGEFISFMSSENKDNVVSKAEAEKAFNLVTSSILKVIKHGHDLLLTGILKMQVKERGARKGRNPKTGHEIEIPAYKQVTITPGKTMKDLANGVESKDASKSKKVKNSKS